MDAILQSANQPCESAPLASVPLQEAQPATPESPSLAEMQERLLRLEARVRHLETLGPWRQYQLRG